MQHGLHHRGPSAEEGDLSAECELGPRRHPAGKVASAEPGDFHLPSGVSQDNLYPVIGGTGDNFTGHPANSAIFQVNDFCLLQKVVIFSGEERNKVLHAGNAFGVELRRLLRRDINSIEWNQVGHLPLFEIR